MCVFIIQIGIVLDGRTLKGWRARKMSNFFLAPLPEETSVAHLFGIVKAGSSISYGGGEC